MIRAILRAAIAGGLLTATHTIAQAQIAKWDKVCGDNSALADDRIKNCTAIIQSKKATELARVVAYLDRGTAWQDKHDFDRAIADYTEVLRIEPDPLSPARPLAFVFRCAARARAGRDLQLALADCNEGVRLAPDRHAAWSTRGFVHLRLDMLKNAIADYDAALKIDPKHGPALYGRGIARLRQGDAIGGKADIAAALAVRPDVAKQFARDGVTPPEPKVPDPPEKVATPPPPPEKVAKPPQPSESAELLRACGGGAPADERIQACTRITDTAEEPEQNRAIAHNTRGSLWHARGYSERAIADFTEAIRLNPKFAEAYLNRGNAWDERGELGRAIDDFSQAIKLEPGSAPTYYLRGYALSRTGALDRAIADYTEAIRLDTNYARAYFTRGTARLVKGEYIHAAADFSDVIRLDPKDAAAYYNRGRSQLYLGAATQAAADLNQASELDPANAYHALWLEIAARRANAPSRLKQVVALIDKSRWPAPIVFMFLGEATPLLVLTAALDGKAARQNEQVCEANFFIGHWALRQGDKKEAARLFRVAANDCARHLVEGTAARAELRALGQAP